MRLPWKVVGLTAGAAGAAVALGRVRWSARSGELVQRLREGAAVADPDLPTHFDPVELEGLPAPVARYFQFALRPGQPLVRTAHVEHQGAFRTRIDATWSPFRSVQDFSAVPAGFVWDARIRMAPLVTVRVRDHYLGGSAGMYGALAGLVPVVNQSGTAHLAVSALHRQLAERVWLPTALLPRQGVRWSAVDGSTARATLRDAGHAVSMRVSFSEHGPIERVAMTRLRDVAGVGVPTPFLGTFGEYVEVAGMQIPLVGEVAWILPEGRFDYWRARIVRVAHDFRDP